VIPLPSLPSRIWLSAYQSCFERMLKIRLPSSLMPDTSNANRNQTKTTPIAMSSHSESNTVHLPPGERPHSRRGTVRGQQ